MRGEGLRLSATLLTAVPLPGGQAAEPSPPDRRTAAAAMCWAPVIGLALGAAAAGVLAGCEQLRSGPLLAAVLAIGLIAALTRGLHLDGLADLADGLGSRAGPARALEIMKQSDIGPFGVLTLVLTLLVQVSALARAVQLGRGPAAIVVAAVAGRLAITVAARRGVPAARGSGLGALVAGSVSPVAAAAVLGAAVAGAAAAGPVYVVALSAGQLVALAVTAVAVRRLGGITGDVLGAITELATTAALLVTALS